jgi:hypothetical protein
MIERRLLLLGVICAASLAKAEDAPNVAATKTWEVPVPEGIDFAKLPMTGPIPNSWQKLDKDDYKSGYVAKKEQFVALWKALGKKDAVPEVDFGKESVVVINFNASKVVINKDGDGKPMVSCGIGPGSVVTLCSFPKESVEAVVNAKK